MIGGLLYHAWDLASPSQLWMRRMLDHVSDGVVGVADRAPPPKPYDRLRYYPVLADSPWRARLLRLTRGKREVWHALRRPSPRLLRNALRPASAALVHFLNVALNCPDPLIDFARKGGRLFVHLHGIDVTWDARKADGSRVHPDDYLDSALAFSRHATLIANSNFTRGRLVDRGFDAGRIVVKPLGVEVPPEPLARPPHDGPLRLLYLGRLIDFKGPDLTLQAFRIAVDRGLDARLTFAGDGPMRPEMEAALAEWNGRDRVRFLGSVDAATGIRLRREADAMVAHNQRGPTGGQEEAFGVSYVEAMADALPVVTGGSGALAETVGVTGDDLPPGGVLVEPGDVEGQADALLALARDHALRTDLGRAGHARAATRYTLTRERITLRALLGWKAPCQP